MPADTEKHWGTGKRKSSVARVRLFDGPGNIVVNRRTLEDYFPRETSRMVINQPFEVTSTIGQYHADVNVYGGGVAAQAVAVRHAATLPARRSCGAVQQTRRRYPCRPP